MTPQEIKDAVDNGQRVFWVHAGYEVVKGEDGEYSIICIKNNNCIGLTWIDGKTLNGEEGDFYLESMSDVYARETFSAMKESE